MQLEVGTPTPIAIQRPSAAKRSVSDTYCYLTAAVVDDKCESPISPVADNNNDNDMVVEDVSYTDEEVKETDATMDLDLSLFDDEIPSEYWTSPAALPPTPFLHRSSNQMQMQTPSASSDDEDDSDCDESMVEMGRRGRSWGRVGINEPHREEEQESCCYDVKGLRGAFGRDDTESESESESESEMEEMEEPVKKRKTFFLPSGRR